MEVTVMMPDGKEIYKQMYYVSSQLVYPDDIGGSTSEVGVYSVSIHSFGLVEPGEATFYDDARGAFTVVARPPQNPAAFLVAPALSVIGLGIAGLAGLTLLVRIGLVRDPGINRKIQSILSNVSFLVDFRFLLPSSLVVITVSAIAIPLRVIPIVVLSFLIVVAWGMQTVMSLYIASKVYPRYWGTSALYVFGWMSTALHEFSHAIISKIFGAEIKEIYITPDEGHVIPEYRTNNFASWCGRFFGALAPAYFFPGLLLLLWLLFFRVQLNLPYQPLTTDIYTPFNKFAAEAFVDFFYWLGVSFANPLMYAFMYFLIASSLGAGPSQPIRGDEGWGGDWLYALRTVTSMPKHTLTFTLGFLSVMCLIAFVDYEAVVSFFGFWVLLFILITSGQIIGLIFTRLSMARGVVLMVLVVIVNVTVGYVINEWTQFFHWWACTVNANYC